MKTIAKVILVFILILVLYFSIVLYLVYQDPRTFMNYTTKDRNIKYFDFNYSAVNMSDNIDNFYDKSLIQINNFSIEK